jgi:hypothetical protein
VISDKQNFSTSERARFITLQKYFPYKTAGTIRLNPSDISLIEPPHYPINGGSRIHLRTRSAEVFEVKESQEEILALIQDGSTAGGGSN